MKNFSIILAMLFLAFTVEAQNVEETKRTKDRKTTRTSVSKKTDKSSKTIKAKAPAKSKSRAAKSSRSSKTKEVKLPSAPKNRAVKPSSVMRSTSNRNTKYSSDSPVTRSSKTRSSSSATPSTRTSAVTKYGTTGNVVNRTVSSRKLESSDSRTRSSGTGVLVGQRDRNSQSVSGYIPKTKVSHAASRKVYTSKNRVKRKVSGVFYSHRSLDYRRVHNPYIIPKAAAIFWNINMYRNYRKWYPDFNLWYYPYGYRIHTVSAYDAYNYIGDVARIYGRVTEVWYSREYGEYYLYIGGHYPNQDFTIILESRDAKRFSWNPVRYFTNRHLTVTGLVSLFDNKPEMQIRKRSQISMY